MTKFADLSPSEKTITILTVLLLAFIVAGAIGYLGVSLKESASTEGVNSWATKTRFIAISPILIAPILGAIASYVANFFSLKLPYFVHFAITVGSVIAIIDGTNVLLGINSGEFWSTVSSGFLQGSIAGAIVGILIQKTEKTAEDDSTS